ncbi:MAG: sugar phosphate isomerase/epimerase [Clostridiales bacterium]|nr:sugar phosphate isomerase/epimerase [Clostridiales bacterium]
MLISGLTSVTFRKKSIKEVVALCKEANLLGIEWGGDIHVPPTDSQAARDAAARCRDEGLRVFSYGSYYSPTKVDDYIGEFEKTAETALVLGTDRVRIWASEQGRAETSERAYAAFVERMQKVGEKAAEYGVTVCFEHHQNTVCDGGSQALQALCDIAHPNVKTYWQPICPRAEDNLANIELLSAYIQTVHVYNWIGWDRYMLEEGKEKWEKYIAALRKIDREIPCLLEFTKDDSEENYFADAACLHALLK